MAQRRFKIKGTKDFLVLAVFLGFLCVWSIRDAWFPTKKILKKHPLEIPVAFSVPGVLEHIPVSEGQEIGGKVLLAKLYDETYRANVLKLEAEAKAAKEQSAPDLDAKLAELQRAREALDDCTLENTDITWKTSHGDEPLRGRVLRILVQPAEKIEAGQTVMTVTPTDTFYLFNKTLAVLSFFGMLGALFFHWVASH